MLLSHDNHVTITWSQEPMWRWKTWRGRPLWGWQSAPLTARYYDCWLRQRRLGDAHPPGTLMVHTSIFTHTVYTYFVFCMPGAPMYVMCMYLSLSLSLLPFTFFLTRGTYAQWGLTVLGVLNVCYHYSGTDVYIYSVYVKTLRLVTHVWLTNN